MTEQLPYQVVGYLDGGVELRRYPEHAVAEVTTHGSVTSAGNIAFATLFAYISGYNRPRTTVAMTAPVVQGQGRARGQKVTMTAPVVQEEVTRGEATEEEATREELTPEVGEWSFAVAFVLPTGLTVETAPEPADPRVTLRTVPSTVTAAIGYSGRWRGSGYEEHRDRLLEVVARAGLEPVGPPRWLRYDPPFKPWFLRRNEVVVDLREFQTAMVSRPPQR
ncbi:heme-binding protein [Knoellia sp. p5-6-4]|uniref:SOUL family heme-binding protein n=1 Tax=unclassified Knoellia TaxID=2618719 RepID=UPI0023DAD265|nr:heme-binding protein [Knoellia sp. p5-6-4]MDF2144918.1 heme-binding protein [Knoellia sp. p5-6-4]